LITRLGEVIGADGALIERHRQSGGKAPMTFDHET
jgi:hypothetical protein